MDKKLIDQLIKLPTTSGVYIFKNAKKEVIYVGKAKNLRNRVRSYFAVDLVEQRGPWLAKLQKEATTLEHKTTESGAEALILEANLIKQYNPRYNSKLKDDKSPLYIIITKEKYPRVYAARRTDIRSQKNLEYYGPFTSSVATKEVLRFLQHLWGFRSCKTLPKKVCLKYHLGLCPGVCEGKMSESEYKQGLGKVRSFLQGHVKETIRSLEQEMHELSESQQFEKAAALRDSLRSIIYVGERAFEESVNSDAYDKLVSLLKVKSVNGRVDAFDVSNISGTDAVASRVTFTKGLPNKNLYRHYKIKYEKQDDYAMLAEAVTRSLGEDELPELVILDGGVGQLSAVIKAQNKTGQNVPLLAIAKGADRKGLDLNMATSPDWTTRHINLPGDERAVRRLLTHIREEAHRFAISYFRKLHAKESGKTLLGELPGFGKKTEQLLLKEFGSISGLRKASASRISKLIGPNRAAKLMMLLEEK